MSADTDRSGTVPSSAAKRIIVAHITTVRAACRVVAALQAQGYDCTFECGFFYKRPGSIGRWLWFLPRGLPERLERIFMRRHFVGIDPAKVRCNPLPEFAQLAAGLLRLDSALTAKVQAWTGRWFDARIARKVRRQRPDMVIAHDGSDVATLEAAKRVGALAVLHQTTGVVKCAVETYREEAQRNPEFRDSLAGDIPIAVLDRYLGEARAADYILAPSEYVRGTLVLHGIDQGRIAVVPYGVDVARFHPAATRSDDIFRILFVGHIGQQKGIKYLLEAYRRLALQNAELVLIGSVIGSGAGLIPYRGLFRHIAQVPHAEIAALFRTADIFAFPSLHEGSALSIYEALASGLPVIATPNSGSVVRDGEEGFIVPIRDVEALMDRILRLYRDTNLRRDMARKARLRAEQFTWDDFGLKLGAAVAGFFAAPHTPS